MHCRPFTRVLIANRGEIAVRIIREINALGLTAIAIYSDADEHTAHVMSAKVRRRVGPASPALSYLNAEAILRIARETGAEAVHPGYGFLAENADFAEAVIDAGMVWIGPSPASIRAMGDKGAAKAIARNAGVPLIPGYDGEDQSDATLAHEAAVIGWPVMIKAAMGGGGRGMRRVGAAADFGDALASARREAQSAFGDARVILEKAIDHARHVEIQVFGDSHGTILHLGERDCSVQRRNQKVIEEAPAPGMTADLRAAMGAAAVTLARAVDYTNAGTVEFLLGRDGRFHFLEMNTRIQVEHPVTEEVTGLNLVRLQFEVAMGKALPFDQDAVTFTGHAIEARLCAEDPEDGFKPQRGTLSFENFGGEWPPVRLDMAGTPVIGGDYDSMIAKVIAKGATREEARVKLEAALAVLLPLGIRTNRAFLRGILNDPVFVNGEMETTWLNGRDAPKHAVDPAMRALAAALLSAGGGWSSTGLRRTPVLLKERESVVRIDVAGGGDVVVQPRGEDRDGAKLFGVSMADGARQGFAKLMGSTVHIGLDGMDALFDDVTYAPPETSGGAASGEVRSPMAGKIAALAAAVGMAVAKGDLVAVLESMKMEHEIRARLSGTITAVAVAEGQQVAPNALLATIAPEGQA